MELSPRRLRKGGQLLDDRRAPALLIDDHAVPLGLLQILLD